MVDMTNQTKTYLLKLFIWSMAGRTADSIREMRSKSLMPNFLESGEQMGAIKKSRYTLGLLR